jgi:hypothetical protein
MKLLSNVGLAVVSLLVSSHAFANYIFVPGTMCRPVNGSTTDYTSTLHTPISV